MIEAPASAVEADEELLRLRLLNGALLERTRQLQEALDSRVVIEQAKGVLAERLRTTPEQAFTLLRSAARAHRMKLRALAAAVVASRETPQVILRQLEHAARRDA